MVGLALSPELVDWAATALGWRPEQVQDESWDHAESAVARLIAPDGRAAYLKAHRQPRKLRQERAALERWAPALPGTPRLLTARDEEPAALLLSARSGVRVDAATWDAETARAIQRAAGAWLRRLHGLPHVDDDPLTPAAALQRRHDAWAQRAAGHLPAATLAWVAEQLQGADLGTLRRVPCHRDFGPRNWLWDEHDGLSVIDFEHARPDLWWVDVQRLVDEAWLADPGLEGAFWRGYGRQPTADERALGQALSALYAVGTVVWAVEHGDDAFEALGRSVLRRLRAPGAS